MMNERLRLAVYMSPRRAYQIAQEAGMDPSTLSKWMCGISKPRPNDKRVIAVCKVLGVDPDEIFSTSAVDEKEGQIRSRSSD
jgi:transcriptional regulator with XRE-family HTH domain